MTFTKQITFILFLLLCFWGCENYQIEEQSYDLNFPIGRSYLGASEIEVVLNGDEIYPEICYDSCGGFWLKIPESDLPEHGNLIIRFIRKKGELQLFNESYVDRKKWMEPSYFIDSENEVLISKAAELTADLTASIEKAKRIHQYVSQQITFNIYKDSFLDKASVTYELGYGTCMNFSRLYVALCRAAGIPSRTIWGIVYGHDDDHIYDYHHQWAEVLDDSGYWHPADFNYSILFDLNDIRYLDLIYAAEENTVIRERASEKIILEGIHYYSDYPATLTGRLGFVLIQDARPDSMTVEYTYEF